MFLDLLRSVLTAMEGELDLLSRVRITDADGVEKSGSAEQDQKTEKDVSS